MIVLKINDISVTLAQQLLCQLGQSSKSSQPGNWVLHTGESIEAVTVLSQKMRGIWLFEQRMWANSWTSLLGSVWNNLGTAAAGREDAASSACAQHTAEWLLLLLQFSQGFYSCSPLLQLWKLNCPKFCKIILTALVVCWEFFLSTSMKFMQYSLTLKVLTVTELT